MYLPAPGIEYASGKASTVIWATGMTGDFSWIHLPILNDQSKPSDTRGVSAERGLYFIGFPWLNSRKSGVLLAIAEDAHQMANTIGERLKS